MHFIQEVMSFGEVATVVQFTTYVTNELNTSSTF